MSTFYAKGSIAQDRQLKVQRLVIPFKVTHSATAANVVLSNDEPDLLFMQSNGVNQITAKSAADAALFNTQSPTDSSGQLNMLVVLGGGESALKVMHAIIVSRTDGTLKTVYPDIGGTPAGIGSDGAIMLYAPTGVNFTTTDLDACLVVEYQVTGTGN